MNDLDSVLAVLDQPDALRALLRERPQLVTADDDDGRTPLHHAASRALPSAVEALIEHGAVVGTIDYEGHTPLHVAVAPELMRHTGAEQHPPADARRATVRVLLAHGISNPYRENERRDALELARPSADAELVRILEASLPPPMADSDFAADVSSEAAFYARLGHILPDTWPGKSLEVHPTDFETFLPTSVPLYAPGAMPPLTDWTRSRNWHPLRGAPLTEPAGGTVYFDGGISEADFHTLLQILRIPAFPHAFGVFVADAEHPLDQRFLAQMRILRQSALAAYGITDVLENQPIDIPSLMWAFTRRERLRPRSIRGTFGGDGDWAKERLCFGVMVENEAAFRIWSRAWLITK